MVICCAPAAMDICYRGSTNNGYAPAATIIHYSRSANNHWVHVAIIVWCTILGITPNNMYLEVVRQSFLGWSPNYLRSFADILHWETYQANTHQSPSSLAMTIILLSLSEVPLPPCQCITLTALLCWLGPSHWCLWAQRCTTHMIHDITPWRGACWSQSSTHAYFDVWLLLLSSIALTT